MLVKNPLTEFLYECEYNGIENIYIFWIENRESVLEQYQTMFPNQPLGDELTAFELKVRWASVFGLYVRLQIARAIRESAHGVLDLKKIKVRYGNKYLTLEDFNEQTNDAYQKESERVDVRGISILKKRFEHMIIRNVDFSFCAFEASVFHQVTFENCKFDKASFADTRMINCRFDEFCSFVDNNFSCTLLDSDFDCIVKAPRIKQRTKWHLLLGGRLLETVFLQYTVIKNLSFAEQCDSLQVKEYAGLSQ